MAQTPHRPPAGRISGTLLLQVLGDSAAKIAEQLGLNKNTVMTRLFRARNQIKEAMESAKQQRGHTNG
jgi:RNA polymerase sigma-70 factor (ECF subfamily)